MIKENVPLHPGIIGACCWHESGTKENWLNSLSMEFSHSLPPLSSSNAVFLSLTPTAPPTKRTTLAYHSPPLERTKRGGIKVPNKNREINVSLTAFRVNGSDGSGFEFGKILLKFPNYYVVSNFHNTFNIA